MERFAPDYFPVQPLDTKFGPNGDLYVLEYGSNTVRSAVESRLVRIEYHAGNRKPIASASADKKGGAIPFTATLRSTGTIDHDGDELKYEWRVQNESKSFSKIFSEKNPQITFDSSGVYTATLSVTDKDGERDESITTLIAGNEPPKIDVALAGNKTFFFDGTELNYSVNLDDKEDGKLGGAIKASDLVVSATYASEGFDLRQVLDKYPDVDRSSSHATALAIMRTSDCRTCHTKDVKAFGPALTDIAKRYMNDRTAVDSMSKRIIEGSGGLWGGDNNMPAHPLMTENDAKLIARYILSLTDERPAILPVKGKLAAKIPPGDNGRGSYFLHAAYKDKGASGIPSALSDTIVMLRSPRLLPLNAGEIKGAIRDQLDEYVFLTARPDSYIAYNNIDLTGIQSIKFIANWHLYDIYPGGKIEVRLDSPNGELIGETTFEPEQFNTRYRGLFDGLASVTPDKERRMKRYPKLDGSKFFARGVNKNDHTIPSYTNIKTQSGFHNLYFVFKNDSVGKQESLFPLALIELRNRK
jgi:cytochrome c